jgi:xanthine/uracil permease
MWMVLVLGFQHILVMYGEVALFPGIAGKIGHAPAEHIAFATFAAILVSALCTLVQVVRVGRIGAGFVIFMGSSTAYLACGTQAVQIGGFALVGTMAILSAPVEILLSYFLRHLRHIVTPAVGGTVILLIVISFMPMTIREWMGEPGSAQFGSTRNLSVGLITLGIMLGINVLGTKTLKIWCPIIALGLGYVAAWVFGILEFHHMHEAPWFGLPLILETGANSQIGLLVGVSVCVGMLAESQDFFPMLMPPSLAPVPDSGIAAGGLMALIMSTTFHLMPKPRLLFRLEPSVDKLPMLVDNLDEGTEILKLTSRELATLQLACEEVFVLVVSHFAEQDLAGSVQFQVTKDEDGVFAEIQTGTRLSDVDGP